MSHFLRLLWMLEHLISVSLRMQSDMHWTVMVIKIHVFWYHLCCSELWISLENDFMCMVRNSNKTTGRTRRLTFIKYLPGAKIFRFVAWNDLWNQPGRSVSHSIIHRAVSGLREAQISSTQNRQSQALEPSTTWQKCSYSIHFHKLCLVACSLIRVVFMVTLKRKHVLT